MAKRGPKPKATFLKKLEGNPGRRELNDLEPECHLPPVKPHAVGMDELASTEWDRIIAAMPRGIYTALDVGALATYALAWSMMVKAQNEIDQDGLHIKIWAKDGPHDQPYMVGSKVNPAARTWKAATETLLKTADRLGLVPSARVRLKVPSKEAVKSKFGGLVAS